MYSSSWQVTRSKPSLTNPIPWPSVEDLVALDEDPHLTRPAPLREGVPMGPAGVSSNLSAMAATADGGDKSHETAEYSPPCLTSSLDDDERSLIFGGL